MIFDSISIKFTLLNVNPLRVRENENVIFSGKFTTKDNVKIISVCTLLACSNNVRPKESKKISDELQEISFEVKVKGEFFKEDNEAFVKVVTVNDRQKKSDTKTITLISEKESNYILEKTIAGLNVNDKIGLWTVTRVFIDRSKTTIELSAELDKNDDGISRGEYLDGASDSISKYGITK